jgi:uncharacterized membrane protein
MSEKEIKKAKGIFVAEVIGSVTLGVAISDWNYWLGMALAFIGPICGLVYFKSATARERLSDERLEYVNGKAGAFSHKVMMISSAALLVLLGALESSGVSLSAMSAFGPYFAFMAVFHVICYHYYERRYG